MFTDKKSRYRNKYYTPSKPLLQSEVHMRQIIQIEGNTSDWYAVIMIGVMWLPDLKILEPNALRCIVAKIDGRNGDLIDDEPLSNVLLQDK
jgi:hypothetical protein